MQNNTVRCQSCSHPFAGNYCGNCGTPAQLKRVDGHYVLHEIQHLLHLEKGFLYTIKQLLLQPGKSIHEFISTNRNRLVKPVMFLIITSLIYTSLSHILHIHTTHGNEIRTTGISLIFSWIEGHWGYANIMMGVFVALWLKLFFRKQSYNLFELLILLCFVMGMGMLLLAVFMLVQKVFPINIGYITDTLSFLYCGWATGQFFNKNKAGSYVKALIAYALGITSFYTIATILVILIDTITHK